jgi:hypothetical protein
MPEAVEKKRHLFHVHGLVREKRVIKNILLKRNDDIQAADVFRQRAGVPPRQVRSISPIYLGTIDIDLT